MTETELLKVRGLGKTFALKRNFLGRATAELTAVKDVSFSIRKGETLALVGESGSGKSTTGKLVLRLLEPTSGSIEVGGVDISTLSSKAMFDFRRKMQIIFQDPFSSLDPRTRIGDALEEGLIIHRLKDTGAERRARVIELLDLVGLRASHVDRFPHEFSGGQRQRIGIARALAVGPDFLVADEPVSALDVSVQAQIINLLESLQKQFGLAMLFIAHDLAVVRHTATNVAVMYLGQILEIGKTDDLFTKPQHPYTEALLSAIPVPTPGLDRHRIILKGDIPSPLNPPSGCPFRTRCMHAQPKCGEAPTHLIDIGDQHSTACIRHDELYGTASVS